MSVYHYQLIHIQLTIEREKKTKQKKKKTKVIKAYNSIFFPFFPPACLNFLGGLSVLRWLPGDSRLMASKQIGEEA